MGFKCPVCFKDFLKDMQAWKEHCNDNHNGAAADIVEIVNKTTRPQEEGKDSGKRIQEN